MVGDKYLFYLNEVQSNDDIPDDLKRELASSDLSLFTLSSVSFRETHSDEALEKARAFAKSP